MVLPARLNVLSLQLSTVEGCSYPHTAKGIVNLLIPVPISQPRRPETNKLTMPAVERLQHQDAEHQHGVIGRASTAAAIDLSPEVPPS
jgi:hypothetical protein